MRLAPVYVLLSAVGLVSTWWFNLSSAAAGGDYPGGWFGTAASSSAAVGAVAVAVAFVLPLFLACREVTLSRLTPAPSARPAPTTGGPS